MWGYRRYLFTILITVLMLPSAIYAQLDCDSAITIARDLIISAQAALDQHDPTVAANLMEQASILLRQSCTTANALSTAAVEQTAEVIIPTEVQPASPIPPTAVVELTAELTAPPVAPTAIVEPTAEITPPLEPPPPAPTALVEPTAELTAPPVAPTVIVAPTAEVTPPPEVPPPPPSPVINPPPVDVGSGVAFLRFVHTSIDSGPVDIYAQNLGGILLVQNLQYDQFTDFISLPSGQHTFVYRPAGSGAEGAVMSTLSWNFGQDTSWMVAVAGRMADYSFQIEPFTLLRGQMNGNARVRVVNWVSSTQRITLSSDQGVDFGRSLGWIGIKDIDFPPGAYTLTLTTESGQTPMVSAPYEFAANTLYALMITGVADGNPPPHLISIPSYQDITRVRFVNNRAEAVDIHMRPGNQRIVEALAPGQMTDYLSLPNGAATFVAYAPGTGPRGQELSAFIDYLRPARDLTVALQPDGSMGMTELSWTPR